MDPLVILERVSQSEPAGNTKTAGNQCYRWCFTLKGEHCTGSQLSQELKKFCKEFYFQKEKGKEGFIHWQGCLSLMQKHRLNEIKSILTYDCHWEQCKNWFASKNYVSKSDTRIEGPYDHTSRFIELAINDNNLYEWQKEIVEIIKQKPHDRKIYWYWERKGGVGKSTFTKYLWLKGDVAFFTSGKTADIAYAYNGEKTVVFDLPRTTEERFNYNALEQLKNGMLFSSKYESGAKVFAVPHVFIFANWEPERAFISDDKWVVSEISSRTPTRGEGETR